MNFSAIFCQIIQCNLYLDAWSSETKSECCMRTCWIMCWKLTFETYWRITVCIRLNQWGMVLNTMFWCCCYMLEFSVQIRFSPIQFWVSRTSFWPFSNFSLLTCQILFLMHAFFSPLQPIRIFLIFTRVIWCSSSCDELSLLPVPCPWCPCGNREDQKHDWKGEMS